MRFSPVVRLGFILLFAGAGILLAQSDISQAVLKEQAQGLEAVDEPLEKHLQEQTDDRDDSVGEAADENPEEIFEAPVPDEIPFEDEASASLNLNSDLEMAPEPEKFYEKVDALEPVLMLRGNPVVEAGENIKKERIRGRIIPEKRNIKRRRFMFRWVLQTEDGRRIPLKSNLQLLTLVRKEELLDGPAMLTGYFVASAINPELQYFNVEKAVPAGDSDDKEDKEDKSKK